MNPRERVLKALEIEEPDRVPISEMDIDIPLMETITGRRFPAAHSLQTQVIADRGLERKRVDLKIECYRRVGFDMFTIDLSPPEGWEPSINPDGTMVDLWGRVLRLDERSKAWVPYSTIFDTPEDFDDFPLPDPDGPGWTYAIEYANEVLRGKMALAAFIRDPFAHAWEMLTPLKFVIWMYQRPDFIKGVLKRLAEFNVGIIKRIAEAGVDLIISGGDYCEEKGPMVPVEFFREVVFPCLKRQVEAARREGVKFIKHTDGNILPLLDDLGDIVDGLHSLDPSAGVDIGDVKERYGDRLILMGNVSVDNLARRSREEIVEETKSCIKAASPGGGHILSSSNSWAAGAKLENCLAMVEAGRRYGIYPIRL
jgi:uroporphyrinogen decarboxylase